MKQIYFYPSFIRLSKDGKITKWYNCPNCNNDFEIINGYKHTLIKDKIIVSKISCPLCDNDFIIKTILK